MDKETHSRSFMLTESGFLASQIASPPSGECPYTLFIGAGVSRSSGISPVNELIREWRQEIYCHLHGYSVPMPEEKSQEFKDWENTDYPGWLTKLKYHLNSHSEYGTLFQYTRKTREERQMYVEKLVSGKFPSPGYMYLAGLIDEGKFNRILTTNFDDLLNDALVKYYSVKPINCAFDSAVTSFNNSSLRPKIIKLHGDFLYDNIKNTDEELLNLSENMESKMIEMCEDKGLVVIGYSGNDESIMAPIRENLRKNKNFLTKGIHWCLHKEEQSKILEFISEDEISEPLRMIRRRYPDRVFLYSVSGFDKFMESVFNRCKLKLPDTILSPHQNNVANDFYKSCEALEKREKLTLQIRTHMDQALESMKKMPDPNQLKLRKADQRWRDGAYFRDEKRDYNRATEKFKEAIEITDELLSLNKISDLLRLKAITRKLGCHIGMVKVLYRSKKSYTDEINLLDSLSNKGIELESSISKTDEQDAMASLSLYYNILCALGVEADVKGEVTEKIKTRTLKIVEKLNLSDIGRAKLDKLKSDDDIDKIRHLLG